MHQYFVFVVFKHTEWVLIVEMHGYGFRIKSTHHLKYHVISTHPLTANKLVQTQIQTQTQVQIRVIAMIRYTILDSESESVLYSVVTTNFGGDALNYVCGGTREYCQKIKTQLESQYVPNND